MKFLAIVFHFFIISLFLAAAVGGFMAYDWYKAHEDVFRRDRTFEYTILRSPRQDPMHENKFSWRRFQD